MRIGIRLAGWGLVLMAMLAGCKAIEEARRVQKDLEPKGRGVAARVAPLDLHECTLEQLVAYALTNRPSVVAARLDVEDARLELAQIQTGAPLISDKPWGGLSLDASADYSERSAGTHMHDHEFKTEGNASAGLSLSLLVWDFGRYDAEAHAQVERILAAEQNLSDVGFTVFEEVASAYFTYLSKCAHLDVALTNAYEYAEHLRRAEARLKAGEAQSLDVLKARLDLAEANETVVAASNLVATSGASLMNVLGIDASRGTCEQVFGHPQQGLGFMRRGFLPTTYGVEDAFALARTNAPSIQVARTRLRAASADVDYAIANLKPKVTASTSLSWADPLWTFKWGFSAVQELLEGLSKARETELRRARVALEKASAEVDQAEQQLSLDLETAIATRDNSLKAIDTALASIKSARENLEVVREQLGVGSASRIELSEAISSFSSAVGSGITAFYSGQVAESKMFRLLGRYPTYDERDLRFRSK